MARYEHLPIYKAAFDLLVYFETIVKNMSRYHKYSHGADLRNLARQTLRLIVRANNTTEKLPVLEEIRLNLEELKTVIRICKEIKAFHNFNSFQTSMNLAIGIAKQNEGWMKHQPAKGRGPESQTDSRKGAGM